MTNNDINQIVNNLIEEVGSKELKDITDYLNIKVITRPGITTEYINKNNKKIIYIDTNIHEELKEFVIAHEIGHAVLHDAEIMQYSPLLISKTYVERQADYFAFKLLGKNIDETYDYTSSQYAKILGVNEKIIEYIFIDNKQRNKN